MWSTVRGLRLWIYGVGLGCGSDTDLGCVVGCAFRLWVFDSELGYCMPCGVGLGCGFTILC